MNKKKFMVIFTHDYWNDRSDNGLHGKVFTSVIAEGERLSMCDNGRGIITPVVTRIEKYGDVWNVLAGTRRSIVIIKILEDQS